MKSPEIVVSLYLSLKYSKDFDKFSYRERRLLIRRKVCYCMHRIKCVQRVHLKTLLLFNIIV